MNAVLLLCAALAIGPNLGAWEMRRRRRRPVTSEYAETTREAPWSAFQAPEDGRPM